MSNTIHLYLKVSKYRVVLLMVLTALVGIVLAPKPENWGSSHLLCGLLGIGLMSASGGALNHLAERHVDRHMQRTQHRPLPQGQLASQNVLLFSLGCMALSCLVLLLGNNLTTVLMSLAALWGYAVFYTLWLKPMTSQNIVIGGLSGALPPLLGWVSVTGELSANAWILVLIIFTWTPPHFWALAINRLEDYRRINYPMLPVTHGVDYTCHAMVLYTVLMLLASELPYVTGMSGLIYLIGANVLGITFLADIIKLNQHPERQHAMQVFWHSIRYLTWLFIVMLIDHFWIVDVVFY